MRHVHFLLLASLLFAPTALAQTAAGPAREASVREELQALVRELNAAWEARDRAALERIYAPEFVWVHGFGYVDDRATHIEEGLELHGRSNTRQPIELVFDPPNQLLIYGDAAVLRVSNPGRGGNPSWGTTIYARKDGRWQIVQIQGTALNPERTPIVVAPAILDDYAGRYDRGGGVFSEVTREGDALVVRHPTLPRRTMTPVAENRFFDKGSNEYTFERGPSGRVTHLVIRTRTGQELQLQRVP